MSSPSPSVGVKSIIEFIGTFFLVGAVGLAIGQSASGPLVDAVSIAAVLTAAIYMGSHLSGAHYNPLVTLALAGLGRMPWSEAVIYLLAQFSGGLVAAGLVSFSIPESGIASVVDTGSLEDSVRLAILEFLFTFLLIFTVLNVGFRKSTAGNSYHGIAVGLVVLGGGLAVGPISGAVFNPAVALSLASLDAVPWSTLPWYLGSQLAGAEVAAAVFGLTEPDR